MGPEIAEKFSVITQVKNMIGPLSYSDETLVELASIIVDSLVKLEFLKEGQDEKEAALAMFEGINFNSISKSTSCQM